jgi:nicotinate-nucleotide--dimethylbenzimidazole phosphoribosyltransferase
MTTEPQAELEAQIRAAGARVQPLDAGAMAATRERLDQLTKPVGSLGRLEELALQLAGITGQQQPRFADKVVIVLAADHGVAAEGVSAYPQAVTAQMVRNFLNGGAAINALARAAGARVVVVDLGVATEMPPLDNLLSRRIGPGTANFAHGPAMSRMAAASAISTGMAVVEAEAARGLDVLALGEMGIANTTASSAIVAALTGRPAANVTGRGTGIDEAAWIHKIAVVEHALALNQPDPDDPIDVLAKVGGYEIGGLVGAILAGAGRRIPIVLDGFISGAAALLAARLCPAARPYLIAGHCSPEPGHQVALGQLGLSPLLDLGLRLGEGSGAALALHVVDAATAILSEMATFADAGVAQRAAEPSV